MAVFYPSLEYYGQNYYSIYLNGCLFTTQPVFVADSSFHTAGGSLECFGHQYLGDGVGVLTARLGSLLDGVCETSLNNKFCGCIYCFISCPYHCWFVGLIPMITKSNFLVKFEGNKHLKKVFSEQIEQKQQKNQ
jgi:hypothetical protein